MTTHLHVHLEPNERKRRQAGAAKRSYDNSAQFFAEHVMNGPGRNTMELGGFNSAWLRDLVF